MDKYAHTDIYVFAKLFIHGHLHHYTNGIAYEHLFNHAHNHTYKHILGYTLTHKCLDIFSHNE